MKAEILSTSEAHTVDLVSLRAWHWSASCDATRDCEMRKWHRDQCRWISLRMGAHEKGRITSEAVAVIELSAEAARQELHHELTEIYAGDWEKHCQLAREAIIAKLKTHPGFEELT